MYMFGALVPAQRIGFENLKDSLELVFENGATNKAKFTVQYMLNKRHPKFCQHLIWFEKSAKK
jgi:hypothetical protein